MNCTKLAAGLALAMGMAIAAPGLASAQKIVVNEVLRAGNMEGTDEFIELLLVEDLTAAELNTFYFGDSTGTPNSKFAAYQFTNMQDIATTFPAGTIIVAGGATSAVGATDTSYDPENGDWNIELVFGTAHITKIGTNTADFASTDVAWVDTEATGATISADGFAVKYGPGTGTFGDVANVSVAAPANNFNLYVSGADHLNPDDWSTAGSLTPGEPNGGENTDYIEELRRGDVLLIELESFTATAAHASAPVVIDWTTASEIDTVGYHVARARVEGGPGPLVNNALIPAKGSANAGASYSVVDPIPVGQTPRAYYLIELDANGKRTPYGPFPVSVNGNPAGVAGWSNY